MVNMKAYVAVLGGTGPAPEPVSTWGRLARNRVAGTGPRGKRGPALPHRDIFERVIHLSLAPKRMKFFFKRYLDYEKQHGTEKDVQAVKAKALDYVEAKSSVPED